MPELQRAWRIGEVSVAFLELIQESRLLPDDTAEELEIIALKEKKLFVRVENPILLQELGLKKRDLLTSLNLRLAIPIKELIFKLGKLEESLEDSSLQKKDHLQKDAILLNSYPLEIENSEFSDELKKLYRAVEPMRQKLVKQGEKICEVCGKFYSNSLIDQECGNCRQEKERDFAHACSFLRQYPWMDKKEFVEKTKWTSICYEKTKEHLIAVNRRRIPRLLHPDEESNYAQRREIKERLIILLSLEKQQLIIDLTDELIKSVFDPVTALFLIDALKKNKNKD
jgi:hypothetical protein